MFLLRRALFALAISMVVPVCAVQAATITVDRTDDADVSACSSAANDCTFRGAINKANATAGADTINFADSVRGTIQLGGTSLPDVTTDVTINGPGADQLTIDGVGRSRILSNATDGQLKIKGLTFTRGNSAGSTVTSYGGAINNSGTLTLTQCVFNKNVIFYSGGAINNTGTLTIDQSSFTNNSCYNNGGAILNSGTLTMSNSTVADNRSEITSGGGIANSGTATVINSTFSGNSASGNFSGSSSSTSASGGGIYNTGDFVLRNCTLGNNFIASRTNGVFCGGAICSESGSLILDSCTLTANFAGAGKGGGLLLGGNVTIGNSIISGNSQSDVDISPTKTLTLTDKGYNLLGTGTAISRFTGTGNQIGADPKFGTFFNHGGFTSTYELLPGSPAIDAGQTTLAADQRGIARPQGSAADIGAYEREATTPTTEAPSLVVTTLSDITANDGQTSLREAIDYANLKAGADTITFANNLAGTIALNAQLPAITGALTIQGPGAKALAVDGGGATRLLQINSVTSVTINDLTLSGGRFSPTDGRGGGILNEGTLSMSQVAVSNNRGIEGGGIANLNGVLTMVGCLLSNNVADNSGGGILNNNGQVTLINSSVSNNSATGSNASASGGGGLDSFGSAATMRLECVTLTGNSAPNVVSGNRAGVWLEQGAFTVHNSILYGNGEGVGALDLQNDVGTLTSTGYNIFGALSANAGLAVSDRVGINPQIGARADNGGPTFTHALLAGSPAINTGDPSVTEGFDQRGNGFPRVRGGIVDVGAFEVQSDAATPIVTLSPQNPTTNATLTATPTGFDAGAVYSYVWKNNTMIIPNETAATLDLSKPGNGDVGDILSVEVTTGAIVRTASVKVVNLNRAPFAYSRNVSATAAVEASFELRGSDPDGDAITFEITQAPANGTAELKVDPLDGKIKLFYRSRPRFNGVDVIRFVSVDTSRAKSQEATFGIAVKYTAPPVNRAPVAGDTNIDTYVDDSVVKGLLGRDPDGDAITFRIVNNAKYGQSEIKRDTDGFFKLFYTSLNRFYGNDRVTYIAIDSRGKESNLAAININFINRAPLAQNNNLSVASGEAVSQYLFGTDADNDALTFRLVNNPQYGTGAVKHDEQGNWRVYYQSAPGYVGADRITFIAVDPQGKESQVATANINVVRVGPASSTPGALQTRKAPSSGKS